MGVTLQKKSPEMEPHGQNPWTLHEIPSYANLPVEQILWQAGA
jgi:hypothetical protein